MSYFGTERCFQIWFSPKKVSMTWIPEFEGHYINVMTNIESHVKYLRKVVQASGYAHKEYIRNQFEFAIRTQMNNFAISSLLLFSGAFTVLSISITLFYAFKSYGWHQTKGVIEKAKIFRKIAGSGSSFTYAMDVKIKYIYSVAGKKYSNSMISAFEIYDTAGIIAKKVVKKYPPGKTVNVYYDPHDPQHSCLEQGLKNPFTIIMLIIIFLFAVILLYSGYNFSH